MRYQHDPVVVRALFPTESHRAICQFVDEVIPLARMDSDIGEPDGPSKFGRRYAHNVPFFVDIHQQLTEFASELFGNAVRPSYSFLSMYETSGQCPLHIDRPQCRYTIDYLISQEAQDPWPINIGPHMSDDEVAQIKNGHPVGETADEIIGDVKWTQSLLKPNDAVCYSGTNCWHYRPTKSDGKVNLVFFHFVPEGFNGPLD